MLAHGAEKAVDMWEKVNAAQVAGEEIEPCPTRQAVARDLDIIMNFDLLHLRLDIQSSTIWMK